VPIAALKSALYSTNTAVVREQTTNLPHNGAAEDRKPLPVANSLGKEVGLHIERFIGLR
jgi:hypothetical protein